VISAVDLVNGIGVLLGLERVTVPARPATSTRTTAARPSTRSRPLPATTWCSCTSRPLTRPDTPATRRESPRLERIDGEFLETALSGLRKLGPHRVLVAPDHYTPIARRSHVGEAVPFAIWPTPGATAAGGFTEAEAAKTGLVVERGHELLGRLFARP